MIAVAPRLVALSAAGLLLAPCGVVAEGAGLTRLMRRESTALATLEGITDRVVRHQAELSRLEEQQRELDYELAESTRRVEALSKQVSESRTHLRARLKALYRLSRGGYLRLLLESRDSSDLVLRAGAVSQLVKRDGEELQLYRERLGRLQTLRRQLDEQKATKERLLEQQREQQLSLQEEQQKHLRALKRIRRSRRRQQKLSEELTRRQRLLLARISRLERRVINAGGFAAWRGRLPRPVKGPVVEAFTRSARRGPRLKIARSGVTFRVSRGARVRAVHAGVVAMVQRLEGYGHVVVVDHGEGYYSVYGMLSGAVVKADQSVRRGTPIGRAGVDPLSGRSAAYFELRNRQRPLDPTRWFRGHRRRRGVEVAVRD